MDLSGPGIDVKLKERKKERRLSHQLFFLFSFPPPPPVLVVWGGGFLTYPKHLTFIPFALGKCCPPFSCMGWLKGRNFVLQNKTGYFGEAP